MDNKRSKEIYTGFIQYTEMMKPADNVLTPESIDQQFNEYRNLMSKHGREFTNTEAEFVKNQVKMNFDIDLASKAIHISDDKVTPWIKNMKSSIEWKYWDAYESYLKSINIPRKSIIQTSEEIDNILDLTGNPRAVIHS